MSIAQDSIGLRWENILQERYPSLISTRHEDNVPDFYHPSGFWIEAKAGNVRWGGRLKWKQLAQVKDFSDPTVYAFGMHNFNDAEARLTQKNEGWRQRCLEKNMDIVENYFISSEVVRGILEADTKVSGNGMRYCMVKPCTLRNIIFDRTFSRDNKRIESSADYYGFERGDYYIDMEEGVGYVLNLGREEKVIDFFRQNT